MKTPAIYSRDFSKDYNFVHRITDYSQFVAESRPHIPLCIMKIAVIVFTWSSDIEPNSGVVRWSVLKWSNTLDEIAYQRNNP